MTKWYLLMGMIGIFCSGCSSVRFNDITAAGKSDFGRVFFFETAVKKQWALSHSADYSDWSGYVGILKGGFAYVSDAEFSVNTTLDEMRFFSRKDALYLYGIDETYGLFRQKWIYPYVKKPEEILKIEWQEPLKSIWIPYNINDNTSIEKFSVVYGIELIHESSFILETLHKLSLNNHILPLGNSKGIGVKKVIEIMREYEGNLRK